MAALDNLRKHPAGKVNLAESQRGGALGHIPLCPKNVDKLRKLVAVSNSHYLYMKFLCKIELQQTESTLETTYVSGMEAAG